jgi:hypothetical protein
MSHIESHHPEPDTPLNDEPVLVGASLAGAATILVRTHPPGVPRAGRSRAAETTLSARRHRSRA